MTNSEKAALSRRTFVKGSALAGLGAAAMGSDVPVRLRAPGPRRRRGRRLAATGETAPVDEKIVWTHCHVNCGGACVLQCHVADDEIVSVESDNTGDASFGGFQARACLRGRSIRRWINGEDRLNYPMKRVEGSKRGEGKYEQISWDEALDTIASEFKRITEAYGNESVFIQECSGVEQNVMMNNPWFRLFNLCGGVVTRYGNYSNGALTFGAQLYTYGGGWGNRSFKTLADGELVVMFGNAPCDTRMAGDGHGYDLLVAMEQKNVRVISIDPRRSEIATNRDVEWIPIRPGTDAALVAGIAHELIKSDYGRPRLPAHVLRWLRRGDPAARRPGQTAPTTPTSWAPATTWWRRLRRGLPPSPRFPSSASSTWPMRSARPSPASSARAGARSAAPTARPRPAPSRFCLSSWARWACPPRTPACARATAASV